MHGRTNAMDEKNDLSDRVLSDLFAPTKASPSPEPEKRSRGRPAGTKSPLLAPTTSLHLEDFYFLRSVINGLSATEAYERYYSTVESDAQGRLLIPHGHTLLARARRLIAEIVRQAQGRPTDDLGALAEQLQLPLPALTTSAREKASAVILFEEWAEQHADMFRENELAERYQEYLDDNGEVTAADQATEQMLRRSNSLQAKLRALNALQTELARRPVPEHVPELWLSEKIAKALRDQNIVSLFALVKFISINGKHWYRQLHGIGLGRARRIEQWLDFHSDTLPRIDRGQPLWQRERYALAQRQHQMAFSTTLEANTGQLLSPSPALALVPLDLLAVPPELDGSRGTFRSPNPNQLGAQTDLQAIKSYLSSFVTAGKLKAFDAYRREVERFYLWCLIVARTPLSSITLAHAQAYQLFLQNIPREWINPKPVERFNPAWRPFRGPLAPKNQNYALGVLKQCFRKLMENGYLTSSPFASIQKTTQISTGFSIDTTRAFNRDEMQIIRQALDTLPGLTAEDPMAAALARRTQLIMQLLLSTGMRRSELANASLATLATVQLESETEDAHTLQVVGKGSKNRTAILSSDLLARIRQHHNDVRTLRANEPEVLKDLDKSQPVIASLERRPGSTKASDTARARLSSDGIYRSIKAFLKHAHKQAPGKQSQTPNRLDKATPHWTRHTFAHAILDSNFKGKGLPITQRLLGHKSLSTTGQYLEQDTTDLILASRQAKLL